MLKRLQWRFIRIAMGSTLLVFVFLLAAINVLSYGRLLQGADAMLRFISDNDGRLPEYAAGPLRGPAAGTGGPLHGGDALFHPVFCGARRRYDGHRCGNGAHGRRI